MNPLLANSKRTFDLSRDKTTLFDQVTVPKGRFPGLFAHTSAAANQTNFARELFFRNINDCPNITFVDFQG
jgi:hypothetical protein